MVEPTNGNGAEEASVPVVPLDEHVAEMRALSSALVERFVLARAMGMTHGGKRDTWGVFGYDDVVTWQQYRERYARGGIAKRIVNAFPKAVWRGEGIVFEDEDPEKETEFEKAFKVLNAAHRVWPMCKRTHTLASLGSYAVILIGATGDLSTELPKNQRVLYLRPIGGGVRSDLGSRTRRAEATTIDAPVAVKEYDENPRSPRFGLPTLYQLRNSNFASDVLSRPVHWSRIVHVPAPDFVDDELFGPPILEAVWNYLLDLDKVAGGGAEAFWMRANAGLHVNVDKKMPLPSDGTQREAAITAIREQVEQYVHQMSRVLRTTGTDVNQLGSDVADFSNPQKAILTLIAGTTGIPMRILSGSEMGTLASEQDKENWNDQVQDVRDDYAQPTILRPLIERLTEYGYLPQPEEWNVEWPEGDEMSEVEKIDAAAKLADVNSKMGETIVTVNEVREFMGYEPFTDAEMAEMEEKKAAEAAAAFERQQESASVEKLEAAIRAGGSMSIVVKP